MSSFVLSPIRGCIVPQGLLPVAVRAAIDGHGPNTSCWLALVWTSTFCSSHLLYCIIRCDNNRIQCSFVSASPPNRRVLSVSHVVIHSIRYLLLRNTHEVLLINAEHNEPSGADGPSRLLDVFSRVATVAAADILVLIVTRPAVQQSATKCLLSDYCDFLRFD